MLRNAPKPETNVVDKMGTAVTIGSPISALKPAGLPWIPAKIVARMTEIKVNAAEAVPSFESMLKVRGRDESQQITETIAPNDTVWQEIPAFGPTMVFKYLAPTRTWRPCGQIRLRS